MAAFTCIPSRGASRSFTSALAESPRAFTSSRRRLLTRAQGWTKSASRSAKTLRGQEDASIPNFGDHYRNEEAISSAVAESAVNQIVGKRFVKKQQMRWTKRGAHLLLQVRTRVLDDTLMATFQRCYPGMETGELRQEPALVAS